MQNEFQKHVIWGLRIIIMLLFFKEEKREKLVYEYLDETEKYIYR